MHAKHFSASASERWLNCTASVKLYADAPTKEDTGSVFAREGSCAHEVADLCLHNDRAPDFFTHHIYFETEVTQEMAEYVQQYLDYIDSFKTKESVLMPEQRVDYSNFVEGGFGTADAIMMHPDKKHVDIFDLKYGKGVRVDAENNPQAQLYALGVLNEYSYIYDIHTVTVHIVQPRLGHYSSWDRTLEQLIEFGMLAQLKSEEAWTDDRAFKPTEKGCMWCDFKHSCKALEAHTRSVIGDDFDDLTTPELLSDDEVRVILDNAPLIKGFIDSIEGYVKTQLELGHTFPGYKLVEGRSVRKYTDKAQEYFKGSPEFWETKLLAMGKVEKMVGKKEFAALELTIKPPGKPTLVKESDKRKAIITNDFETLDK